MEGNECLKPTEVGERESLRLVCELCHVSGGRTSLGPSCSLGRGSEQHRCTFLPPVLLGQSRFNPEIKPELAAWKVSKCSYLLYYLSCRSRWHFKVIHDWVSDIRCFPINPFTSVHFLSPLPSTLICFPPTNLLLWNVLFFCLLLDFALWFTVLLLIEFHMEHLATMEPYGQPGFIQSPASQWFLEHLKEPWVTFQHHRVSPKPINKKINVNNTLSLFSTTSSSQLNTSLDVAYMLPTSCPISQLPQWMFTTED